MGVAGDIRENGSEKTGVGGIKLERPGSRSGSCSSNRSTPSLKSKDVSNTLLLFLKVSFSDSSKSLSQIIRVIGIVISFPAVAIFGLLC